MIFSYHGNSVTRTYCGVSRHYLTSRDPRHQRLPLHFGHGCFECCCGDYLNYSDGVGGAHGQDGHRVPRHRGDARVDELL